MKSSYMHLLLAALAGMPETDTTTTQHFLLDADLGIIILTGDEEQKMTALDQQVKGVMSIAVLRCARCVLFGCGRVYLFPHERAQLRDIASRRAELTELIYQRACRDEIWYLFSNSTDIVHFSEVPEYLRQVRRRICHQMDRNQVPMFLVPTARAVVTELMGHLRRLKRTAPPPRYRHPVKPKNKQRRKKQ